MTGQELAEVAHAIRLDIPIILCSGYSHMMGAAEAAAQGIDVFLTKPVDIDVLADTIQQVLARSRDGHEMTDNYRDGS